MAEKDGESLAIIFKKSIGRQILEAMKEDERKDKLRKKMIFNNRKEKIYNTLQTVIPNVKFYAKIYVTICVLCYCVIFVACCVRWYNYKRYNVNLYKSFNGPGIVGPPGIIGPPGVSWTPNDDNNFLNSIK